MRYFSIEFEYKTGRCIGRGAGTEKLAVQDNPINSRAAAVCSALGRHLERKLRNQ